MVATTSKSTLLPPPTLIHVGKDGRILCVTDCGQFAASREHVLGSKLWEWFALDDADRVRGLLLSAAIEQRQAEADVGLRLAGQVIITRLTVWPGSAGAVIAKSTPLDSAGLRLSAQERAVLLLICDGCAASEIAATLEISVSTVMSYRSLIAKKTGAKSTGAMVRMAIRSGLITA